MSVVLCVRPEQPAISWKTFCERQAPFSIALDGYVNEGPRFQPEGPRANFNHHEEVDRLATRATCGQVLMAIRQGLFDCFRVDSKVTLTAFVNDCDEDVCLSWFLLSHGFMVECVMNPRLNRLVAMEDALDATAGAYPYPKDLPMLREIAWVFDPYRRFRMSGEIRKRDPDAFRGVITDVGNRIKDHIIGNGEEQNLNTEYKRIGGGGDWAMIKEIGHHGRTGAFANGIRAYVSVHEGDNAFHYTIGRMSPFIPFPVQEILATLNAIENTPDDPWGGGNTIGGSPRVRGSKLNPATLEKIINDVLRKK